VPLAHVLRTRTGKGGVAAVESDDDVRKFLVDFTGGPLQGLGEEAAMDVALNVGNGEVVHKILSKMPGNDLWRLIVDVRRSDASKPVELSAALVRDGKTLSETWTYQWGHAR
jgi:glucans biosynthesis protein